MSRKNSILFAMSILSASTPGTVLAKEDLAEPDPRVYAAYVLLGQADSGQTVAMARVVQDASAPDCPRLVPLKGGDIAITMTPRINPDSKNFPVQVCEALYHSGQAMAVERTGFTLPRIGGPVHKVTALGDTGCKPEKASKNDRQSADTCSPDWWPFPGLAEDAAATKPTADLIVHMGDYNYRGTPGKIKIRGHKKKQRVYDAGDNAPNGKCKLGGHYYGQNSKGSEEPDSWQNWWLDLFQPAGKLLQSAPWVFARGNHELCSRAGPGWFYFLDTGSKLLGEGAKQLSCPEPESNNPLVFGQPYRVDLQNLTVLVVDSANACDSDDLHQKHYDRQFAELGKLVQDAPVAAHTWYMSHRALWGVKKAGDGVPCKDPVSGKTYGCINKTLETALHKNPLPETIHLSLAGHMHRFQSISFPAKQKGPHPPQLILGNGGVELASNHPKKSFTIDVAGLKGIGFGLSQFGYMEMTLGGSGDWRGQLLGPTENSVQPVLARCDSKASSATGICWPLED